MIKIRIRLIPVILLGLVCLFPGRAICESKTVTACGMGEVVDGNTAQARASALADAQRNAVEKGLGTLVAADTIVNNAVLIKDRIYSQAKGYVTDYHVTAEGLTPSGRTFETCIEATVATTDIENDLRAMGILRQRVGNPRFVVAYLPQSNASANAKSLAVREAETAIKDAFLKKGFIVINRSASREFSRRMARQDFPGTDFKGISQLALAYQAELLLLFDVDAVERTGLSNPYFKEISLSVTVQAVACGSAEEVCVNKESRVVRTSRTAQQTSDENPLIAAPMRELAKKVAELTFEDTVAYFERRSNDGTLFTCRFNGFSQDEMTTIVGVIENMAGTRDNNVRRLSTDQLQVDVNYLGKSFDLQRELKNGLGKKGISLRTGLAEGTSLLFLKNQ